MQWARFPDARMDTGGAGVVLGWWGDGDWGQELYHPAAAAAAFLSLENCMLARTAITAGSTT